MPDDIRPVKHVDVTKVTSAYDGWKLEDVVTPTGEWINLASPGDAGELQAILDQHKDCWAVIVDCHI